jgi:bifunctional DNase/RNase
VSSVRVTRLESAIFYAEVLLDDGTAVDARPSDAFVLAVAADVSIEIDPVVLAAAGKGPPDEYIHDLAHAGRGGTAALAAELRAEIAARAAEIEQMREPDARTSASGHESH